MRRYLNKFLLVTGLLLAFIIPARAASDVAANDTARFLAGMTPSAESPLMPLTQEPGWQQHARFFDQAFGKLDERQIARIRNWTKENLTTQRPTMFYMFSGPDFLYADAFFPRAMTYVLSGLEPVGSVPDLAKLPRGVLRSTLRNVESSMGSILTFSFFITKHMKSDLRAGQINGTLPLLYVFLARSGKTVREVEHIRLDDGGNIRAATEPVSGRFPVQGVKIVFSEGNGEAKTLYYFSTNLANDGVTATGFLKFCEKLAPADSLIKSASYLMHTDGFSRIRDFILSHSAAIVQDDSGIPLKYFGGDKWTFSPFGRYYTPLDIFPGTYQRQYTDLFRNSRPINFGIGYRWRTKESNLLLAIKKP
jgi:hypothetical protein